jgi:asparagine synthase (glutamine-hydrolysing)
VIEFAYEFQRYDAASSTGRLGDVSGIWSLVDRLKSGKANRQVTPPRTVERVGSAIACGYARLQNVRALRGRFNHLPPSISDLALAVIIIAQYGRGAIRELIGEFGFAIAFPDERGIMLARDALGIAPLYYAVTNAGVAVGSQATPIAPLGDEYDLDFLGDYLVNGANAAMRTAFRHVTAVAPGSTVSIVGAQIQADVYWSPSAFPIQSPCSADDAAERFRDLFDDAVAADHTGDAGTWSALSGGLDSSSIVVTSAALASDGRLPAGLGGTITGYDTVGKADERAYSGAVVAACGVRNVLVRDGWPWQDFDDGQPLTDQPALHYVHGPYYRALGNLLRNAGARVYLSGLGADHYLGEDLTFLSDVVARRQLLTAAREVLLWSIAKRRSVWQLGFRQAVLPLTPRRVQARRMPTWETVPSWIRRGFALQYELGERNLTTRRRLAKPGMKYPAGIAHGLMHLAHTLNPAFFGEAPAIRYPYLYRPLVEFCLGLPPEIRFRPNAPKFVLRSAMRGRLPELVRTRRGKGATGTRHIWALKYERSQLAALVEDPILAQLGCVSARRLQYAFQLATQGQGRMMLPLIQTLGLETWLRVREGRWHVDPRSETSPGPQHSMSSCPPQPSTV